jgi:hypothetical protein
MELGRAFYSPTQPIPLIFEIVTTSVGKPPVTEWPFHKFGVTVEQRNRGSGGARRSLPGDAKWCQMPTEFVAA